MDNDDGKLKASPPTVAAAAAVQQGDGDETSLLPGSACVDDACATTSNSTAATLDIDTIDGKNDNNIDDNNIRNDDQSSSNNDDSNNDNSDMIPPSKFKIFDKVIARDKDGLMYDAVIRRCLYGSAEPQQIPIGLFSNAEAEAILRKRQEQDKKLAAAAASDANDASGEQHCGTVDSEPPAWHYFVHYNKWAVNWDRWVRQDDVYEPTDKIQAYAARIQKEHKDLSNRLASSKPGKKKRQTIDGNAFLGQWRLRLERIDAEMDMYNPLISPFSTTAAAIKSKKQDKGHEENEENDGHDKKSKKGKQRGRQQQQSESAANTTGPIGSWSKATLAAEMKNRTEHNLTNMRQPAVAKKLVLPFALHKILVDQWEIISQCGMLPSLPAPVTVRQILDRYLASKQQQQQQQQQQPLMADVQLDGAEKTTTTENANEDSSPVKSSTVGNNSNMGNAPSLASAKSPPTTEQNSSETKGTKEGVAGTSLPEDGKDMSSETKQEATLEQENKQDTSGEKDPLKDSPESSSNNVPQEFIEMAEGIASFFDQALPTRLLYRQEIPQLRVLDAILPEECKEKRLSEIYGGEHLLRLFIRLPEALVDGFAAAAAAARSKSKNDTDDFQDPSPRILALLSDFARFLHKHQSTLFCQSHRKWIAIELKEQQKMNALQQRRKRAAQQQPPPPTPSSVASTSSSKNDHVEEGKVEADSSKRSKSPPSSQRARKRPKKSPTN